MFFPKSGYELGKDYELISLFFVFVAVLRALGGFGGNKIIRPGCRTTISKVIQTLILIKP